MKILLNIIGILIFFLNRFNGRKDKTAEPSVKYWVKDNWPELLTITLFDLALMILLFTEGLQIDFEKLFPSAPEGIAFTGDLAVSFFIGLIIAWAVYSLFKTKVK